jgi:hypothetical protein
MATPLLSIDPVSDGYNFTPADNVVATKLEGGASRRRTDIVGGASTVGATWIVNRTQYTELMGFFRERLQFGTRPFRMTIVSDVGITMPHVCVCFGDLPRLTRQRGNAFWVQGTFEVTPNPTRSFQLGLQSVSDDRVISSSGGGTYTAEMNDFPIGRQVILTDTDGTVNGVALDVDGTYTILGKPLESIITLVGAPAINPNWTVLRNSVSKLYFATSGACILVPE